MVVFKPKPHDLMRGRFTIVLPDFECAACGERIMRSSLGPMHDMHIPGPIIRANY